MKIYIELAREVARYHRLQENGDLPAVTAYDLENSIREFVKNKFPRGSGFDMGTDFDLDAQRKNELMFETSFHHMDEHGGYDGWTEHRIYVESDLQFGFTLTVTGKNRNQIKDLIHENYNYILNQEIEDYSIHNIPRPKPVGPPNQVIGMFTLPEGRNETPQA